MKKSGGTVLAFGILSLAPLVCLAAPLGKIKELRPVSAGVGRLFSESPETIKIVVRDERPPEPILVAGMMERALMAPALIAQYSENPRAAAELLEAGAKEAVEILGMKTGEGTLLEISIKDFRVEWVAAGGFNVIAYGHLQASLKSADGTELAAKSFRYASWDSSSILKFQGALRPSRDGWESAYARAAWEAAAKTLLAHFAKKPAPEALQRVLASLDPARPVEQRAYAIFWLGLAGGDNPSVAEKLFAIFRHEEDQTVYEAAALALARLSAPGAREEFEAILSGSKKLKEWDPRGDAEEAFTLLHSLAILGNTDLGSKVPPTIQRHRERLTDFVRFQETGEIPKMSPKLSEALAKAKKKL